MSTYTDRIEEARGLPRCPQCRAYPNEVCHTPGGAACDPHDSRLAAAALTTYVHKETK